MARDVKPKRGPNKPYRGVVVESGRKWREIRERLGVTQQELADTLNIADTTVSRWERGISQPSPHFRIVLEGLSDAIIEAKRES